MPPLLLLLACSGPDVTLGPEDTAPPADTATDTAGDTGDSGETADTVETGEDTAPPPPPACAPVAEPVYGLEGAALALTFACSGPGEATAPTPVALPAGATWDATTLTVTWTPGLADAGRYDVALQIGDPDHDDVGVGTIWVADAWSAAGNVPVDPATYREEYGLPVVHLTRPSGTNSSTMVDTTMVYRGHTYEVGLEYRGAASLYYPKNSYELKFPPDDEFSDPLEGFPERRSIVLTTTFDDNAYFRQKLCFDIWNALDPTRHRVETMFAVVYINGVYEGLYLLGDHIDGEYWEDQGYDEDGNLYKSVDHAANFYDTYGGRRKSSLHQGYEKKEGPDGDWADLDTLVGWVVSADDDTFRAELGSRVALDEFLDWWILVVFTEADDSGGKNAYLYDDAVGGLWHYAPWDFNHSLGQTWQTDRESATTDADFRSVNNIFNRVLADAELGDVLLDRLRARLAGELSDATLQGVVDAYQARIEPSSARDWAKWGDSYRSYGGWSWRSNWTTHEEEVAYTRTWITDRVAFLSARWAE